MTICLFPPPVHPRPMPSTAIHPALRHDHPAYGWSDSRMRDERTGQSPPPAMREIGRLIRKAREAAGLSQQAASVRAGFKPAALGHWERGSRGIHATDLQRVAVALGVDVRALYPEPPPPRSVVITGRWAWLDPEGSGR